MNLANLETERKTAILNAALKEFTIKGYDRASTNIIAKEAGISKALMFHYISSKQELFLFVYDFFQELLQKEYFEKLDYEERDLLQRLRQSYELQMTLIKQYPAIFDWEKLGKRTKSDEINQILRNKGNQDHVSCEVQLFQEIDGTKFKPELDCDKVKNIIYWSMKGLFDQFVERLKESTDIDLDETSFTSELNDYLTELRFAFYRSDDVEE
ncbi:TetR/AcrR family transcriptional regulator [Enterococcus sp. LJL99]